MRYVARKDIHNYVDHQEPFTSSNMYGKWETPWLYVVYSYGTHFPMYVLDKSAMNTWIRNTDKYSRTTTAHQNAAMPSCVRDSTVICLQMSTEEIQKLIEVKGYAQFCAGKLC